MSIQLNLLKNTSGVTVLEGVIALGLLALVMAGSFGVLLATSRQTVQPDMHEEMVYAVEKANNLLKEYVYSTQFVNNTWVATKAQKYQLPGDRTSICGRSGTENGQDLFYDLSCLLPAMCDLNNNSSFTFSVIPLSGANPPAFKDNWPTGVTWEGAGNPQMSATGRDETSYANSDNIPALGIKFDITCNGYQL